METEHFKVMIIGAGPAGLSTALHLARRYPALSRQIVIVEAAEHPREKICGGGITFHGEQQLRQLGVTIDVPAFPIERIRFQLGRRHFSTDSHASMRIIQRCDFDAALAQAAADQAIPIRSQEKLVAIQPQAEGVTVTTNRGRYRADVVVGADGANSMVRRQLNLRSSLGIARLLRAMTPVDPGQDAIWQERAAIFDFSCVLNGVQGYVWDFPCYVGGRPFMNRGIFDSRLVERAQGYQRNGFKQVFTDGLNQRAVDPDSFDLEGHPVRWFNPDAEFSRPRVLLAGDAAGVDSLFAEGISFAMEYGAIVAQTIGEAFERNDFSFEGYRARILAHPMGRLLARRTAIARSLYEYRVPAFWTLLWACAAISPHFAKRAIGSWLGLLPPR